MHSSRARALVRIAGSAFLIGASLTCDPKETDYFLTEVTFPSLGALSGLVKVGTTPLASATVTVTGEESRSTTTSSSGAFSFTGLPVGDYSVTATAPGFNCAADDVLIEAHRLQTLDLLCTPQVGRIDGTIRLDLQPVANTLVTARQGTTTVGTGTSAANGTYSIQNLPPGIYTTIVTAPPSSTCNPTQRDVTVTSNASVTSNFDCTTIPGSIAGTVLVNGTGQSGVAVTIQQGGTTVGTATTGASGAYSVANLPPGSYTASINAPANTSCTATSQTVTVVSNQAATANFSCASLPGTISGNVFVDMTGRSGVTVTLTQNGTTIGTTTTGAGGAYSFANITAGSYTVAITPPANTGCPTTSQSATVQPNQTSTVSFNCTTLANEFTVTLGDPPPSYRHIVIGVSSEACVGISTSPPQAGGVYNATWTLPNGSTTQRSGVLDAQGKAVDRLPITQLGTYQVQISVTAGGTTRSASGQVTVSAAAGTCPAPTP